MNKKAVSPLVSTILLIGFAALLGVVVMSWGTGAIKELPTDCSQVSISVGAENGNLVVYPKINNVICKNKKIDIVQGLV